MFAQESINPAEVARELQEARLAIGSSLDVQRFVLDAFKQSNTVITPVNDHYRFDLRESPKAMRDEIGIDESFNARFEMPVPHDVVYLQRTHRIVESLATYVMDTALDPMIQGIGHRAGTIRTRNVSRRTTLLLVRFRFDIVTKQRESVKSQIAEECRILAFAGSPANPEWMSASDAESHLHSEPHGNVSPEQGRDFVSAVIEHFESLQPHIETEAMERADQLLGSHQRVRQATKTTGIKYEVKPQLPADVVGIYIYLPAAQ